MSDQVLPETWAIAPLENVGSWGSGGTPSRKDAKAYGGSIPWLKIGDLPDGPVESVEESITEHGLARSSAKLLPADTLLVAMYGSIGKLGITTEQCATNQAIAFCQPHDGLDLNYLFYLLMSERHRLMEQGQGGTQQNISQTILKAHEVPIAPENEQRRIVSKIDELFSRIDEGERALERVSRLVERYRQSVLKAAVTGELTREWREKNKDKQESGEALLARILKARREAWEKAELAKMKAKGITPANDKWKQKYKEPALPYTADLPELPEGWVFASIEQLCFVDTGATPKRSVEKYYRDGTIDWVTSSAVNEPIIRSSSERITPLAIQETNAKVFPVGSLIVAMYGEGKTRGKVSELGIAAATNQACAALLCGHLDASVKAYVRTFFEKNYAALRAVAAGGVQPNLNLAILKETVIALPPYDEVEAINEEVALRLSQVASVGLEFPSWEKQSAALKQKILSSAFTGELVPQDPTDEPASTLLERIAAERGTVGAAAPRRGRRRKSA